VKKSTIEEIAYSYCIEAAGKEVQDIIMAGGLRVDGASADLSASPGFKK
jgi:cystathionine beta-lyase family protein involved in aluminum resistance